jgi:phosphohistidine phosphatase
MGMRAMGPTDGGNMTHLYLVRHGDAVDEEQDPKRPLSETGRAEVEKIARYLAGLKIPVDRIFHSPKLRAVQTAEILSSFLRPKAGLLESEALLPNDLPKTWKKKLKEMEGSLMVVGHLPYLTRLASLLLSDDPDKIQLALATGGVMSLRRDGKGTWTMEWMIAPGQLK